MIVIKTPQPQWIDLFYVYVCKMYEAIAWVIIKSTRIWKLPTVVG